MSRNSSPKDPRQVEEVYLKGISALEKQRDYGEVLKLYQELLSYWMDLLRDERDAEKRSELTRKVEYHMKRAEDIKKIKSAKDTEGSDKEGGLLGSVFGKKKAPTPAPAPTPATRSDFHNYHVPKGKKPASAKKPDEVDELINNVMNPPPPPAARAPARQGNGAVQRGGGAPKAALTTTPAKSADSEYETQILSEMMDSSPGVSWDDIAGLTFAKDTIKEAVILPNLRPDLFVGLRSPPKGVLLYGPPGTGKTLLAKAVASTSGFSFFSISASAVTSKYLGEGEKLMKAVFSVARKYQPSVLFFDEIDSLMSARKDNEHEASRRLKTEFMVQVDGAATNSDDRILIIAATNLPWDIDEAVLRRLVKRIYIPLPDEESRKALITTMMRKHGSGGDQILKPKVLARIVHMTQGYSGSDLTAVCREAAMGPIREIPVDKLGSIKAEDVRPLNEQDFVAATASIRPSVSPQSLEGYTKWSESFGVAR